MFGLFRCYLNEIGQLIKLLFAYLPLALGISQLIKSPDKT